MTRLLRSRPAPIVATAIVLLFALAPLPWKWARAARESIKSPEMSHADREASGGGYYEALQEVLPVERLRRRERRGERNRPGPQSHAAAAFSSTFTAFKAPSGVSSCLNMRYKSRPVASRSPS